jgi:DNA-binding XRE family transcriptional regulator
MLFGTVDFMLFPLRLWSNVKIIIITLNLLKIIDLIGQSGEYAVLLKGLRYREGLSQTEFAKKINISQSNLCAMENGRPKIGKELAKKMTKFFYNLKNGYISPCVRVV